MPMGTDNGVCWLHKSDWITACVPRNIINFRDPSLRASLPLSLSLCLTPRGVHRRRPLSLHRLVGSLSSTSHEFAHPMRLAVVASRVCPRSARGLENVSCDNIARDISIGHCLAHFPRYISFKVKCAACTFRNIYDNKAFG